MRKWVSSPSFVVAALVFVFTVVLRTRHITETFGLLGDQVLYWNIALRPWGELPLGGGPSSVGGTTIGPVFVWTMWGIRQVVGPWVQNLPHAGGIGLSIMQSAADAALFVAIWKRFGSLVLALAIVLLTATAPHDMSLSASIWNPPLAVAFVKLSIACVLLIDRTTSIRLATGAAAAAVLAVQCHSSAVFFAAPVLLALPSREFLAGRRKRALQVACASAVAILVLETPYLLDHWRNRDRQISPAVVVSDVESTIQNPRTLRPSAAFGALVSASEAILVHPWTFAPLAVVLVLSALLTASRTWHDPSLLSVTVLPLVSAIAGFSFWQGSYDFYWFLTLMPSVALMFGLALTTWKPAAPTCAALMLVLVLTAQSGRFAYAQSLYRLPTYGALVRGSEEIRRRTVVIRSIDIEFAVEPTTNTHFIYERVLGGRVTPSAPFAATIERTGRVRFTPGGVDRGGRE